MIIIFMVMKEVVLCFIFKSFYSYDIFLFVVNLIGECILICFKCFVN